MEAQAVKGQVVKVATTADECVRVTVDLETSSIPEGVNVLKWKNNMVFIVPAAPESVVEITPITIVETPMVKECPTA
jgi:urease accessory protein UreE